MGKLSYTSKKVQLIFVNQIYGLISDRESQVHFLSQDKNMESILEFLQSSHRQVLAKTLTCIEVFSENKELVPTLCEHDQLMFILVEYTYRDDLTDDIIGQCQRIIDNLNAYVNHDEDTPNNNHTPEFSSSSKAQESTNQNQHNTPEEETTEMRTLVLSIAGLEDLETRVEMERALIRVKNVFSVTIVQDKKVAVIYARNDDTLTSRLEKAVDEVEDSRKAIRDLVTPRKAFPRYQTNEPIFSQGPSNMSRYVDMSSFCLPH